MWGTKIHIHIKQDFTV